MRVGAEQVPSFVQVYPQVPLRLSAFKTHFCPLRALASRLHDSAIAQPARTNITNPARLDSLAANDICIQCHSQGRPLSNPIEGKYYD
jgi:hypothetical protein